MRDSIQNALALATQDWQHRHISWQQNAPPEQAGRGALEPLSSDSIVTAPKRRATRPLECSQNVRYWWSALLLASFLHVSPDVLCTGRASAQGVPASRVTSGIGWHDDIYSVMADADHTCR